MMEGGCHDGGLQYRPGHYRHVSVCLVWVVWGSVWCVAATCDGGLQLSTRLHLYRMNLTPLCCCCCPCSLRASLPACVCRWQSWESKLAYYDRTYGELMNEW